MFKILRLGETKSGRVKFFVTDMSVLCQMFPPSPAIGHCGGVAILTPGAHWQQCKASPVKEFTGEEPDYMLDDWLPSLEHSSQRNSWTEKENQMQFASHLRG